MVPSLATLASCGWRPLQQGVGEAGAWVCLSCCLRPQPKGLCVRFCTHLGLGLGLALLSPKEQPLFSAVDSMLPLLWPLGILHQPRGTERVSDG